jgi:hypothetical protein
MGDDWPPSAVLLSLSDESRPVPPLSLPLELALTPLASSSRLLCEPITLALGLSASPMLVCVELRKRLLQKGLGFRV